MSDDNPHLTQSGIADKSHLVEEEVPVADDSQESDYAERPAKRRQRRVRRTKGKDSEDKQGGPRFWTSEEEVLFLEALELYGRNWKECAQHVRTRDAKAIASHAQKHFIKLCLNGERLPAKVAETGLGYTLSGKPLDPISSSASAYGFKQEALKDLEPDQLEIVKNGVLMENLGKPMKPRRRSSSDGDKSSDKKRQRSAPKKTHRTQSTAPRSSSLQDDEWEYMRKYRTDYALNRPQRAAARNRRVQMGSTTDNHELVDCEEFMKSGGPSALVQPFTIDIAAEALLVMDFHAHLCEFESIGLLGGTWDAETRHLTVREALPCRREAGSGGRTSVELDPESEVSCRHLLEEKGLVSTGWYHSHPVFSATPSQKDIENQRNYQTLFRTDVAGHEPFVGLIVSPYDIELQSPISKTCGFIVQKTDGGIRPYRLRYQIVDHLQETTAEIVQKCDAVLNLTQSDTSRMDLNALWRDWTFKKDEIRSGAPLTKITKLKLSLMSYFSEKQLHEAKKLTEQLIKRIEAIWNVQLTAGAPQ